MTAQPEFPGLAAALADSRRLRQRKLVQLPLLGSRAVFTDVQGRGPGESTAPSALADLISSISEIGLLQPVLVEQLDERHLLVAGERRLRAMRWGATSAPDNPHFQALPAVVCPGPLEEEERRRWQLVENLARERLQPGELASALLYERCALLAQRLAAASISIPEAVRKEPDPVARFRQLEGLRGSSAEAAAPWSDVLRRVGVQMSPRKARAVVAAFRALPRELSAEMDAHEIALTTRMRFLDLAGGRADAASEIWQAVRGRGRVDLLSAAVHAAARDPALSAEAAVEAAEELHESANTSRAAKLSRPAGDEGHLEPRAIASSLVERTCTVLGELAEQLRAGCRAEGYEAGSLRLLVADLHRLLEEAGS
ncbi:ParB N-terminal domain-containing protein [Actinomadura barringtoniae]|uniref:ParB N-terminal domain-containing protein n=1 Tax=Actinomadura barringtoniae TaxID=1427535 RepID=A0A939PFB8_9ACTN|nr:ParB N-terminal domain-containing protein [Actinomadura barringtoniae]MBO2448679.1 ParB N-terminal domain-containing protein [Actinomadura barringtoniae]